jgi:TonB family protein
MNSNKLFLHARAALCLALAMTFVPAALTPQENEPKVLKKVLPAYPDILKKMGVSGTVRVKLNIGADGSVKDVEARGGNAIFIDSVAAAVRSWKYVPGERQRTADVTVTFTCCNTVTTIP